MGVQGFPTLKIVKPGKKPGKPIVEDYQGARSAKGIVDAVIDKIPNHVKRLKDDDYQAWLEGSEGAKAILFSDKGTTGAMLKALAIDFLGNIEVAQIRDQEKQAVEVFQVKKFPTLVLLPSDGRNPVTYDGVLKKNAIVSFLSQVATPNPDPAPKKGKSSSKTNKSQASKASSSFAKASASQASSQARSAPGSQTAETIIDRNQPTESPNPNIVPDDTAQKPIKLPDAAPPLQTLTDAVLLQQNCLNTKSGTCVLALLSAEPSSSPEVLQAQTSLADIHHKHTKLFPFHLLPYNNPQTAILRKALNLDAHTFELIAVNAKRSWYRRYSHPSSSYAQPDLETWIDSIRMGDAAKLPLPANLIIEASELPAKAEETGGTTGPEAMKDALKDQLPEGVEIELEEIDDEEYDRYVRKATLREQEEEEAREAEEAKETQTEGKAEPKGEGRVVDEL